LVISCAGVPRREAIQADDGVTTHPPAMLRTADSVGSAWATASDACGADAFDATLRTALTIIGARISQLAARRANTGVTPAETAIRVIRARIAGVHAVHAVVVDTGKAAATQVVNVTAFFRHPACDANALRAGLVAALVRCVA
jgi:hypothetical protein